MIKKKIKCVFESFIKNPTTISKYILNIAEKSQNKYDYLLISKRFIDKIKLRILYMNKYHEIYAFINRTQEKKLPTNIPDLFKKLRIIFDYVALNNILLGYSFLIEKDKKNPILTKEDEKLLYLKRVYIREIPIKEFNNKFGHYALNPFELSSKRFSEYSKREIMKIGKFLKEFDINKTNSLEEYLNSGGGNLFSIYSTLREELRYVSLLVINNLRFELIKIQKEKKIKNIFHIEYDEIRRKGYC